MDAAKNIESMDSEDADGMGLLGEDGGEVEKSESIDLIEEQKSPKEKKK